MGFALAPGRFDEEDNMFRVSSAQILLTVLVLTALVAPMTPTNAQAAGVVQVPATPTPATSRPIVVGRMTGANAGASGLPTVGPLTFAIKLKDEDLQVVPGSQFPKGTHSVYVFFDYDNFARGGQIEQVWYVDGKEMGRDRWAWDQADSGTYQGGLSKPDGLGPGTYRLDILLDGKVLSSGQFVIAASPTAAATGTPPNLATEQPPPGLPSFGPITFAKGVENGQPVNRGLKFPAGTKTLYAIFDFTGMQTDAELIASIYSGNKRVMSQSSLWDRQESGKAASVNLSSDRGYNAGQYRLVLSVNGVEVQNGAFEIVSEPAPTATLAPMPTPSVTTGPTRAPTAITAPMPTPKLVKKVLSAKIVYTRVDNNISSIWVMNLDGSDQQKLTDYASDPTWSPDGSHVAFIGYDGASRGRGVYQMKLDGTGLDLIWGEGTAEYLDWSPSGPYLAMHALRSVVVYDGKAGLWRTISKGEQPSFAPDGRRLVAKSCDGGDCGLFIMNRDGSDRHRVTTSADDVIPAWSPTGKQIAFVKKQDNNWDIYIMNIDGSGQVRLTDDPGIDAMPAWLPDGSGIVFRSTRGGAWGIWIMNADGSDQRKIIDAPVADDWGRSRLDVR
jgi:hypothetical protein